MSLSRGLVELCFDSGATVLLEGPAVFKLDSDRRGHLEQGRLTATLQDTPSATADPRFSVTTPTAIIHDRGTSFGVAVDATGETEVSVFSGLVDLLPHLATEPSGPPPRPLRLVAGEAARVASRQPPTRQPATVTYARTLPGQPVPQLSALPFNWQEGAAVTIYEDAMSGAGLLAGSSPAAHAGKGEASWIAPPVGWQRNPSGGLTVTRAGAALLPFKPERGYLYRIRLTIPPPQRQTAEVSFGFTTTADPAQPVLAFPWAAAPGGATPLVAASPVPPELADGTTCSVILDTSQAEWRLFSLVGDRLVEQRVLPDSARGIRHVAIASLAEGLVQIESFSLSIQKALAGH